MAANAENQFDASEFLEGLMFLALDHGVYSRRDGGAIVPFVMTVTDGKRELHRFVAEPYEVGVAHAKAFASKLSLQTNVYAVAYDGYVTLGTTKHDAIVVTGAERGKGKGYLLAQRYISTEDTKSIESVGNPIYLGREDALFEP